MKVALCFIISYEHILNKEELWKQWIKPNEDIINVYFHYKNLNFVKSQWIRERCIPQDLVVNTSYFHVVPAYLMVMSYAFKHDNKNQWFCLLTDSCVPIITPHSFREKFLNNFDKSILRWKPAYWNVNVQKRANLLKLKSNLHLANDPWFILKRLDVDRCIKYMVFKKDIYNIICSGGLANESLFAIILKTFDELDNVINESSTITDWDRMSSATSPHCFINGGKEDIKFIVNSLKENKYAIFLRKVHKQFPDQLLLDLINSPEDFDDGICTIQENGKNGENGKNEKNGKNISRFNNNTITIFNSLFNLDTFIVLYSFIFIFLSGVFVYTMM